MTPGDNSRSAFDYLEELQDTVGSRLSGTPGEAQGKAWLEEKCRALGLVPESDEFSYRPEDWYIRAKDLVLAVGVMAFGLSSLVLNPWLVLSGVVLLFVLDSVVWPALNRNTANTIGHNIIVGITRPWAEIRAVTQPPRLVLLCAHYDTAPASPAWRVRLRGFDDTFLGLAFLGVLSLAVFCVIYGVLWALLQLFGWGADLGLAVFGFWRSVGVWLVLAAGLPGTLLTALSLVAYRPPTAPGPVNPGADDNGSGVAVVLALVAELQAHPPLGWEVAAAFWGAEELELLGSYSFVSKYSELLDRDNTVIINVDTVGRGSTLMAVSGQGIFRRQPVDEGLLCQWEQACAAAGAKTIREWLTLLVGTSDHAAWLQAKFRRALSIGRGDLALIPAPIRLFNRLLAIPAGTQQTDVQHVHSSQDCLQLIRPESLEESFQVIRILVTRL